MNPYLQKKRDEYAAIQAAVEGIQTRAADENRDMTEDELRSIQGQNETAKKLYSEIQLLTEQANRSAAVAALGTPASVETRTSSTEAKDRDPGHYRAAGGDSSFFADCYRSQFMGDRQALTRLEQHNRAVGTSDIAGNVPPQWFTDLFTEMGQQGGDLAAATRRYEISDARPFSLPGQTALTTVANQPTGENGALVDGDDYDSAASVITPATIVGQETVSRQLLDASNPMIDRIILDDLMRSYVAERENRIGAAIKAVGTAVGGTQANFIDDTNAAFGYDVAVDAAMAVWKAGFVRPSAYVMEHDLYAAYLKLKDADGRPILVPSQYGPMNVVGVGSVTAVGSIAGVPVVVSAGLEETGGDANHWFGAMIHGPSVQWFESAGMTFQYEQVLGPQSIKLGLWKYFAVAVRQGTRNVKNVEIADS